jgi:hypothetical protein
MKTGRFALAMLLALGVGAITLAQDNSEAAGQSSTDALAAAARRARQERKDQPKTAKVYTNDNLPSNATISFVGSEPSASVPAAKDANTPAAPAAKTPTVTQNAQTPASPSLAAAAKMTPEQKKGEDEAALVTAKQQLESTKKDLDIQQRKFALDQQSYMSNPNHDSDKEAAAALQTEQDNISARRDEVDAAQKVVNDLELRLGISTTASDSSSGDSGNSHPF